MKEKCDVRRRNHRGAGALLLSLAVAVLGGCTGSSDSGDYEAAVDYDQNGSQNNDSSGAPYGAGDQGDYQSGERYRDYGENLFVETSSDCVATFGVDVDTASYTLMRRDLNADKLPVEEGVRVEEYINFFTYDYPAPTPQDPTPFTINLEAAPSYFGDDHHLLRIGIKGMEVEPEKRQPANLVFLIDISGSMDAPGKLPLVKFALKHLVNALRPDDTIGIVVYAGVEGVVLEPTPVANRAVVLDAIEGLRAGGSTNGEAGIRLAYDMAAQAYRENGINRVVLCTDGDFNVGLTGDALIELIEDFRDRGIFLTTLGFGRGNYNDDDMERLADHGNGNYAYIDSPNEALRVLGENLVDTLQVIAKDVKIQVIFNPGTVVDYRLIGYENRVLDDDDFTNDQVDAGDIGSGHFVTAYFELTLTPQVATATTSLAEVKVRYKEPTSDVSTEVSEVLPAAYVLPSFQDASSSFRFGAAVTEFAEILRHGQYSEGARFDEVRTIAQDANPEQNQDRQEFLDLVVKARDLW